jgi:hypothetical protein
MHTVAADFVQQDVFAVPITEPEPPRPHPAALGQLSRRYDEEGQQRHIPNHGADH